jgi:two-component system nitrogen regulation response regulator GlnG
MKILLVDDSTINNIMMENLLSSHGYDTHSILESESVINNIETYQPDAIILDLMMPGLSGFDILKQMQERSINIPTIVVTAYDDAGYAKSVKEMGAVAYLSKPFNHEELLSMLKNALGN